jgi:hypothetical protein
MVAGVVVSTTALAGATVPPSLSVSPGAGPVGSIVTLRFGPAGNGCAGPEFQTAAGLSGGFATVPFIGDHGSEDFVIPTVLGGPSARPNAPVAPGSYRFVMTCDTTNNPATAITVSVPFTVTAARSSRFVGVAATADGKGYWLAQAGGGVFSYGDARFAGSLPGKGIVPATEIVGIAATKGGNGYRLVDAGGAVFGFGDAHVFGVQHEPLSVPIVGIASTSGNGYWLVASDGSVFSFGDARSYGSVHRPLNQPIVGIAPTSEGKGYWLVASDGGVFSFGDARFYGSMGAHALHQPVVGISADLSTGGYWEVAADGGVFAFHAPFFGSTGNIPLNQPIAAMSSTPRGRGYRFIATDGGVFDFGDAHFYGSAV